MRFTETWLSVIFFFAVPLIAQSARPALAVRVSDSSGAIVREASITVHWPATGVSRACLTGEDGTCRLENAPPGLAVLKAEAPGLAPASRQVAGSDAVIEIQLQPATLAVQIHVTASQLVATEERLAQTPGAVELLDTATLTQARVFTLDEALRKASGVFTRSEEGFSLRPNIGIRGLNPTRSSKVLLLEDGIPISYAPYGDNASYYHPPVERFDSIEVVKGSGQVLYGPSTIGGVVNYVTPMPGAQWNGALLLTGGNRDYFNGHLRLGGTAGRTGLLFDYLRKQGQGSRDNTRFGVNDATLKVFQPVTARQTLILKTNYYGEDSNLTYSGARLDEFLLNPRGNPFRNDFTDFGRFGASATHSLAATANSVLTTHLYGSFFSRDWWRQSSNSAQRPNDAADPACGGMANLNTTCGIEGRLRRYYTWGIEPRVRTAHSLFGPRSDLDFGFRAHFERQDRRQENGPLPASRSGVPVESNVRKNQAFSGFVQNRLVFGPVSITPGVRVENVRYERDNRLLNVRGRTDLAQAIPGLGLSYNPTRRLTLFTGIHRGFSPPRTEDVINNSTGGSIDLDPELSWNYEAGARARAAETLTLEATFFRMDFQNQIIPASVAGGLGATLTSAGRTLHEGFELSGRWDRRSLFGSRHGLSVRSAYTYLPTAEFLGTRYSNVAGFTRVPVTGKRIPYAPTYLLNSSLIYTHASGFNALVEGVFTGRQFADDLNTVPSSPDGQRGLIPGNTLWNVTVNYPIEGWRTTLFATTKNALDRLHIVDRARGILPGMPRLFQAGLRYTF